MNNDLDIKAQKRKEELLKAASPLLKYINEECHPHVTVIVTPTSVEVLESSCSLPQIYDFITD